MTLSGGCCCGAVRYETSDRVFHKTVCHCPTCRRASAAASVAWFSVAIGDYRITAGTPVRYHSSAEVTRTFCGACGTQLTYQRNGALDEIDVTTCSLDDPEPMAPEDHTFACYRLRWETIADGKPIYPQLRAER